jgi:hypothetical protein
MRYGCHLLYKLWHSTQLHWSPPCYMHWEVAGIGNDHPLLCAFAALVGCRFFVGCVLAPQIFRPPTRSQMRMALFHWWLPKNAAGWALQAPECCSPGSETSRISQRPLRGTSGPVGQERSSATTEATARTEHGARQVSFLEPALVRPAVQMIPSKAFDFD